MTGFAAALGGGADLKVSAHLALRISLEDLLTRINVTENHPRAGVGLVYSFGGRVEARAVAAVPAKPSLNLARLGVQVTSTAQGIEVLEVAPKSPAEAAGLHVGDIMTSLDGSKITSQEELGAHLKGIAPVLLAIRADKRHE